mmetsp:Transcript_32688/g.97577  ORF Transcript_32688/g.97577 Transcript_32688/m.97577 type:complete len:222 (+) Transcript_32688:170-835(+)
MRHLSDERDVRVDPHRPEVERAAAAQRARVVARPHRRREPVLHAVRHRNRGRLVGEGLHGDDGPEDFLLHHLVLLPQAGDHARLEEEAPAAGGPAARDDARVGRQPVEEALDSLELRPAVERPDQHALRVHRRRGAELGVLLRLPREEGHHRLIRRRLDHDSRRRGAVLPRVEVGGDGDVGRGGLEVGVGKDDDGRLAAELEVNSLEERRRARRNLTPRAH